MSHEATRKTLLFCGPTPWIGLWERINISVFLLWVVMLSAGLWPTGTSQGETPSVSPVSVQHSPG